MPGGLIGHSAMNILTSKGGTEWRIYIMQGEHAVLRDPCAVISTLLGSCVAVCLWDPAIGVGGMNHFLLPDEGGASSGLSGFGANAMELVVNGLLQNGAERSRFRAKVFGGAEMVAGLSDIGKLNAVFAIKYLERERIRCEAQSLGGTKARRIEFWPASGKARMKFVPDIVRSQAEVAVGEIQSSIELF